MDEDDDSCLSIALGKPEFGPPYEVYPGAQKPLPQKRGTASQLAEAEYLDGTRCLLLLIFHSGLDIWLPREDAACS